MCFLHENLWLGVPDYAGYVRKCKQSCKQMDNVSQKYISALAIRVFSDYTDLYYAVFSCKLKSINSPRRGECFVCSLLYSQSHHNIYKSTTLFFFTSIYRTRPMSLNMEPCMAGPCVCSLSLWRTASYVLLLCLLVSSQQDCTRTCTHTSYQEQIYFS